MKETILALAIGLSCVGGSAQAEPISFDFSGHWDIGGVDSRLDNWFTEGAKFSGTVVYDSEAKNITDKSDSSALSVYAGMSLTINASRWTSSVYMPQITILDQASSGDQFVVGFPSFRVPESNVTFVPLPGVERLPNFGSGNFSLTYPNTFFNDTSLPNLTATNTPGLFDLGMLNLSFYKLALDANGYGKAEYMTVGGSIDSISHPTPEPATLLLFATGMTGLAVIRRRRDH